MDDLEELSLKHSRERFGELQGEASADSGLILADGMIYAIGFFAVITAVMEIMEGLNPQGWRWSEVNSALLGCGALLWLCSQSLNDFKRLLPLWLRLALRMTIGPTAWSDQSRSARIRRAATLFLAALLTFVIGLEFQSGGESVITRSGLPFHIVIYTVAIGILLLGVHWFRLLGREESIVRFD
jgi:hypothetical protein